MTYAWQKSGPGHWRLYPVGGNWLSDTIATVYQFKLSNGRMRAKAHYYFPQSTGNDPENWVMLGTIAAGKAWAERQLAGFWEPPAIEAAP